MCNCFPAHTYKCMFIIRICSVLCLSNVDVCSLYEYAVSCVSGAATCMPTSGGLYHVDSLSKCCSRQLSKVRWLRRNVHSSCLKKKKKLLKPIVFSLYRNGTGLILLVGFVVDSRAFLAGSATHCGKVLLSYVTLWNKTRKHGR